jgi:type IV pilus assembly protein PilM
VAGWLMTPAPSVGVEIASGRVTAALLASETDGPVVAAHATEPLPDGAVVPSLTADNIPDPAAVSAALRRAIERLGSRPRRVALAVPDSVAKVSLVRFENVPARGEDLDRLVRWQVRKSAPFRLEEAQVAYTPGAAVDGGGREFVVALTRRAAVEEYERVCASAGLHAGTVDLASFNLINAVLALRSADRAGAGGTDGAGGADWLLVHVTPEYSTLAIVRGGDVIFFRNRLAETNGSLADLVHQTAMYYEDRLGGRGFATVVLAGTALAGGARATSDLARALEERLGAHVEPIETRVSPRLRDRASAGPALLDALAAPVGIVLREWKIA